MIRAIVRHQNLTVLNTKIVADSKNYLELQVSFTTDKLWNSDKITKTATFTQGDKVFTGTLIDNKLTRDQGLNLTAGKWVLSILGTEEVDGEIVTRITTVPQVITVSPSGLEHEGPTPNDITHQEIDAIARKAVEIAQSVRNDANAGSFTPSVTVEKIENVGHKVTFNDGTSTQSAIIYNGEPGSVTIPTIGENGNWFIDGNDTGYPAVPSSNNSNWKDLGGE